uniref:Protein TsetseEP domain-containing protein n=1 Tax=Anopheles coluzzii TaxID=1518534 RepID=A0A8W7P4N2_ANOCL
MESLRYICWAFCLAQFAFVSGHPEFGTPFKVPQTSAVIQGAMDVSRLSASIDDTLNVMMSGLIPNSESKRLLVVNFADEFSRKLKAVTEELLTATSSNSNVNDTLNAVLDKYAELVTFYNSKGDAFVSDVSSKVGLYVSSEFWTALDFIESALPDVKVTTDMLRQALLSVSAVGDVPAGLLRPLVNALRNTKAHLPLLVYVFQRVGVNFQTADTFIATFKQDEQPLPDKFQQDTATFNGRLSTLEAAVETCFSTVEQLFNATGRRLSTELKGDVEDQNNFVKLKSDLLSFTTTRSLFVKDLKQSIQLASSGNRQSIANGVSQVYYSDSSQKVGSPALQLAQQLLESSAKAEFCHSKYAALVTDLLPLGRIRLNECFDTERPRLQKLEELMETYALMVSYDVEDMWNNLKPCTAEYAKCDCLSKITSFYNKLKTARNTAKLTRAANFFLSALTASLNRVGLCFTRVNFLTFLNLVPNYIEDAKQCVGEN